MNRMRILAITLCILLLTAAGAGVAAAKQDENPRQAGASSVYFYDVAATDTHGSGKLMINVDQKKFAFNGVDFEPGTTYVLHFSTSGGPDLRIYTREVTPSGNLHVEGAWEGEFADPDEADFGVGASSVMMGTIQRAAGEYCYNITFSDAYGDYTVYLPFDAITYSEGGQALPTVIAEPVPVDYVKIYSSTVLYFGYQGVYYTADFYSSPPYIPPVPDVCGSYSPPYSVWSDDMKLNEWYWSLYAATSWDYAHLPPGVLVYKSTIELYATAYKGNITVYVGGAYQLGSPGYPEWNIPPKAVYPPFHTGDSQWLGCATCAVCDDEVCPVEEWLYGPPFYGRAIIETTDGNTYTTTITLPPAE